MDWKSLRTINIITATAILLIIIIGRIFFPLYSIFSVAAGALFWCILYINLRRSILGFIDAHKNTKIQIDPKREERLKHIKRYIIVLWLFFSILSLAYAWSYMREQVIWAGFFIYGILLLVLFNNLFLTVTYLVAKKPVVNISSLALLLFFIIAFGVYAWLYMREQFLFFIGFVILVILLLAMYVNVRDTVRIIRIINDKPRDLKKERLIKIINYLPVIAIIALMVIVFLRINIYYLYILLLNLINPLILLMIIANTWKFISDIS